MLNQDKIKKTAQNYFEKIRAVRQHIHANPELSFKEYKTSEFIQKHLKEAGISFTGGHVETGIIALIKGNNPDKKTLLLRADMDALPIQEKNEVSYKSLYPGIMHACGHDVHSACALGAALILNDLKEEWEGTVKIMFQPGEEVLPGGANLMIKGGVLENPKVDQAIALHVFPSMEAGKVGFKSGMYMASTDELYITVNGKGGHAAMPSEYINPLIIASEILLEINKRFTNSVSLKEMGGENIPTVVAFGKIEGKGATNVIPDKVEIAGTFRTMNEIWREKVHGELHKIIKTISEKYKIESSLRIEQGYPFLVNDEVLTKASISVAQNYLGKKNVEELPLRMTAEDFAFITQKVPSCFFRLGTANKNKGITSGVHTATFDIDEKALEVGMGLMAALAVNVLNSSATK
ncbi:M20 metallopeptidase family protein [Aurantibacillus circumpalustris]|uniref:M20 metallopeptidase family protein n=1 Tax=Aurantibacillus circumpalustris TaxID=3036359 RepID=UPI00295BDE02|nr:M20 family metallopeptidase [Aurantibacillus circumpalustris]